MCLQSNVLREIIIFNYIIFSDTEDVRKNNIITSKRLSGIVDLFLE